MKSEELVELDAQEFEAVTREVDVPVEQSLLWDAFDRAVPGRRPWRRFVYRSEGEPVAVVALSEYRVRGFRYLWAKHGPVWFAEPSAELERRLEDRLVATVRSLDRGIVFLRLHTARPTQRHHRLLQSVTYDRTVVVELAGRSDEEILASMKKRGRRDLRKGLREQPVVCTEETGLSAGAFEREMYAVLRETAARDGFRLHPVAVYTTMLETLGPRACRLFVGRHEGQVQAWTIVTVHDGAATAYYAASTAEGRAHDAPTQLYWHVIRTLRDEGVRTFDLMGIGSELAPSLEGLTTMKTKFSETVTEVAPAWDLPVRPAVYASLRAALRAKRGAGDIVRRLRGARG